MPDGDAAGPAAPPCTMVSGVAPAVSARTLRQCPRQTEAVAVIAVVGAELGAGSGTAELGIVTPRAAAQYAHRAALTGAAVGRRTGIVVVIVVLDPFPYVAAHIVQAEGIGFLGRHRVRGIEKETAAVEA